MSGSTPARKCTQREQSERRFAVSSSHGVHGAVAIRILPLTEPTGPVLEIESADGAKNTLYPATPEAYSLPPGR